MRNIFKRSSDQNPTILKKIPDILFTETNNFHIDTFSRLTPKFKEMIQLQHARQMFQKYLRTLRLHDVFQLYLDLETVIGCDKECFFEEFCSKPETANTIDALKIDDSSSDDCRKNLERLLDEYCANNDTEGCVYVRLYRRYLIGSRSGQQEACIVCSIGDNRDWPAQFLAEIFLKSHNGRMSMLDCLQQSLRDSLKDVWYPEYLQSHYQHKYQLQLLNSGLNSLRLSDFIYSDEYLMLITEFLDDHGLCHYLLFLLAVTKRSNCPDKCSFEDTLDIYSKFLVMDCDTFIGVPSTIANSVVNNICQHGQQSNSASNSVDVAVAFSGAFNPVYLFLEQFWLPQFLISPIYQKHLTCLSETVDAFQKRIRISSDVTPQISSMRPCDITISEDNTSDISIDNASIHSEPTISTFKTTNSKPGSLSWWPPRRLDNRLTNYQSRPMTLGSFDDLGRYQSINSATKQNTSVVKSTSSDILSTITELSSDLRSKIQFNSHNYSHNIAQSPDDVARQIINDIHRMTLRNL